MFLYIFVSVLPIDLGSGLFPQIPSQGIPSKYLRLLCYNDVTITMFDDYFQDSVGVFMVVFLPYHSEKSSLLRDIAAAEIDLVFR